MNVEQIRSMPSKRPTPAQKKRLQQVARGEITRSGDSWVYGHYHSSGAATGGITYSMMCGLRDAGWVGEESAPLERAPKRFKLVLTDAGLAAIGKADPHANGCPDSPGICECIRSAS